MNTDTLKKVGAWIGAASLWLFQYTIWVWIMLLWSVLKIALKFGVIGVILLLIPIIGWIALAILYNGHKNREAMNPVPEEKKRSLWQPWFLTQLRAL